MHMLLVTVIISAAWALVRWVILWLDIFPMMKDVVFDFSVPIVLGFVTTFICRHDIAALKDKIERFGFWIVLVFSSFLIGLSGKFVVNKNATFCHVRSMNSVTPEMMDQILAFDYILVDEICPNLYQTSSYVEVKKEEKRYGYDLKLSLYQTCPLKQHPDIYVGYVSRKSRDCTHASVEELNKWCSKELVGMSRSIYGRTQKVNVMLKKLTQHDNVEGFSKAVSNNHSGRAPRAIYEILDKDKQPAKPEKILYFWLGMFVIGTILILLLYTTSYVAKEYEESVEKSMFGKRKLELRDVRNYAFIGIVPLLCVIVYLLFIVNGYDTSTSNIELFVNWGAISHDLIIEQNQWWRLFNSIFLHAGFVHLVSNLVGFAICTAILLIKRQKHSWIFSITILSGIVSGLFVVFFGKHAVTVGASGAVFGLYGYWIATEWKKGGHLRLPVVIVAVNLVYSLASGISMSGHIGGLVAGLLLAFVTQKKYLLYAVGISLLTIIVISDYDTRPVSFHEQTSVQKSRNVDTIPQRTMPKGDKPIKVSAKRKTSNNLFHKEYCVRKGNTWYKLNVKFYKKDIEPPVQRVVAKDMFGRSASSLKEGLVEYLKTFDEVRPIESLDPVVPYIDINVVYHGAKINRKGHKIRYYSARKYIADASYNYQILSDKVYAYDSIAGTIVVEDK